MPRYDKSGFLPSDHGSRELLPIICFPLQRSSREPYSDGLISNEPPPNTPLARCIAKFGENAGLSPRALTEHSTPRALAEPPI